MAGLFDQLLTCTASVKKLWPKKSRREETRPCDMAESRSLLFPLGRERRHSPFPRVYALFSTIFFRLPRCSNAGHVFTALTFPRFSWKPSERRARHGSDNSDKYRALCTMDGNFRLILINMSYIVPRLIFSRRLSRARAKFIGKNETGVCGIVACNSAPSR